jgi:integrase
MTDRASDKEKRQPFDSNALQRIFGSRIYTDGFRPEGGAGDAAFWLPLLALYTGARLEEPGQLHPDDVYVESSESGADGVASAWVLRITDEGEGQRLKNSGSRRRVPLHPELLRLGFVEFAQSRRVGSLIFHELREDVAGRETGNYSKWFGRWLRKERCVTDTRMTFHSFRHGFKDLCRDVGIDEPVHDALT